MEQDFSIKEFIVLNKQILDFRKEFIEKVKDVGDEQIEPLQRELLRKIDSLYQDALGKESNVVEKEYQEVEEYYEDRLIVPERSSDCFNLDLSTISSTPFSIILTFVFITIVFFKYFKIA